ncbi:MAG: mandelate racemase/muconate lactonizing enzyme family protein [Bryobacteraceae bacterium]
MKITKVKSHVMGVPGPGGHAPSRNWIFVRIETDAGIHGTGEATTEYHEMAVAAMIDHHFGPLLLGQDPTRVNSLWQQMQRLFWWREGVVASSAASGIEQALWDITGKAYGQPVYKLLGGAVRDRIRVYARGDLGLETLGAELDAAMREGFTAFKWGNGPSIKPFDVVKQADVALDLYRQLRKQAGPAVDLMIDCAGVYSLETAHRLIRGLEPLNMFFVEEPVNADTPRSLLELRKAFPGVRIAAGERRMTRWGVREWLEQNAVNVVQADISHCGGIGELVRISACCEVYNTMVAPHNPYGPVALAANAHACAVIPNFLILEHCRLRPWFNDVQKFGVRVQDGRVELPERPGLGVELDWDYVARHPYQALPLRAFIDPDGGMPLI